MQYVITPSNGDKVIYGVATGPTGHDASLKVLDAVASGDPHSEVFFYKALEDALGHDTTVEDSAQLVNQGWFELAPVEPLPGGLPGGDKQIGDALARRFAKRRPDGTWAVITVSLYLAIPQNCDDDSDERVIERYDEFVICTDLHDVDGSGLFFEDRYTGLPYTPNAENLRREAILVFVSDILWDGEEFDVPATRLELMAP